MSDEPKKPNTGPLRKQVAQVEEMVRFLEEQIQGSGVAEFVIEKDRLTALAALVKGRLQDARDFLSDADVVIAITTGAGINANKKGGLLVEQLNTAIERMRVGENTDDPSLFNLDVLGRLAWESRVNYCIETDQTAGGLTPWEDLDEWTRESCRVTAEDLVKYVLEKIGYKRPSNNDNNTTGEHKKVDPQ